MDEVNTVGVHKIGKAGGTTDAGDTNDLFVWNPEFLNHIKERGQNGEVTTTRTPGRFIGLELLFGQWFGRCCGRHDFSWLMFLLGNLGEMIEVDKLRVDAILSGFDKLPHLEGQPLDFID